MSQSPRRDPRALPAALRSSRVLSQVYVSICTVIAKRDLGDVAAEAVMRAHVSSLMIAPTDAANITSAFGFGGGKSGKDGEENTNKTVRDLASADSAGFVHLSDLYLSSAALRKSVSRILRDFKEDHGKDGHGRSRRGSGTSHSHQRVDEMDTLLEAMLQHTVFGDECGSSFVQLSRDNLRVRRRPWHRRLAGEITRLFADKNWSQDVALHWLAFSNNLATMGTSTAIVKVLTGEAPDGHSEDEGNVLTDYADSAVSVTSLCWFPPILAILREHPVVASASVAPTGVGPVPIGAASLRLLGATPAAVEVDSVPLPSPVQSQSPLIASTSWPLAGLTEMEARDEIVCAVGDARGVAIVDDGEMIGIRRLGLLSWLADAVERTLSLRNLRDDASLLEMVAGGSAPDGFVPLSAVLASQHIRKRVLSGAATEQALATFLRQTRRATLEVIERTVESSTSSGASSGASESSGLAPASGILLRSRAWWHFVCAAGGTVSADPEHLPAPDFVPKALPRTWRQSQPSSSAFISEHALEKSPSLAFPKLTSSSDGQFTVMTFNVLVQMYCGEHTYCKAPFLRWDYRRALFLDHIQQELPDVLLLQELQGQEVSFFAEANSILSQGRNGKSNAAVAATSSVPSSIEASSKSPAYMSPPMGTLLMDTARDLASGLTDLGYCVFFARKVGHRTNDRENRLDLGNAICVLRTTGKFEIEDRGICPLGPLMSDKLVEKSQTSGQGQSPGRQPGQRALEELTQDYFCMPQVGLWVRLRTNLLSDDEGQKYQNDDCDTDNNGSMKRIELAGEVVVANVHISSHWRKPLMQTGQALVFLEELRDVTHGWRAPLVFGGDFNSDSLLSPLCRMVTQGIFASGTRASVARELLPPGVDLPRLLPLKEEHHSGGDEMSEGAESTRIGHVLGRGALLESAYTASGFGEPECTNIVGKNLLVPGRAGPFQGLLDYLWFSSSLLRVEAILEVPSASVLAAEGGGLPNSQWPSDHISLAARFAFLS